MKNDNSMTNKKIKEPKKKKKLLTLIWKYKYSYLMLIPGLTFFVLFCYFPIAWLGISFQDFKLLKGLSGSDWIGFANYVEFMTSPDFWMLIRNTVVLSAYSIIFEFPCAILFALLLNEVRNLKFKKTVQTIGYLPHFISVVVTVGLINTMLSSVPPGPLFKFISSITGGADAILGKEQYFRTIYTGSAIWRQTGWNAIVYIAALAGIDSTYYEAASLDGAGRLRQMVHITIPCIMNTIVMMLIIKIGQIFALGFEKAYLLGTDATRQTSEIIATYVYKKGLAENDYGYATAVSVFQSVISFALVLIANTISKRVSERSLW